MSLLNGDDSPAAELVQYWLEQRPDLDPQVLMLELTMARLNLLSIKAMDRIAARHGISAADYLFLTAISRGRRNGPLRPSDLGKLFGLQPSVVTYRVNLLAERHLIDRSPKPDDRRAILLSLTAKGRDTVGLIMSALASRMEERLKSLDGFVDGRKTLQMLLAALAHRWETLDAKEAPVTMSESQRMASPLQDRS